MPQMMPIWWSASLVFVTIIFLMMSIFTYYSMIFSFSKHLKTTTIKKI